MALALHLQVVELRVQLLRLGAPRGLPQPLDLVDLDLEAGTHVAHVLVRLRPADRREHEAHQLKEEAEADECEAGGNLHRLVRLVLAAVAASVAEIQ